LFSVIQFAHEAVASVGGGLLLYFEDRYALVASVTACLLLADPALERRGGLDGALQLQFALAEQFANALSFESALAQASLGLALGLRQIGSDHLQRSRLTLEIAVVVDDVRYAGLRVDSSPSIYFPHRQAPFRMMNLALRTDGDPRVLVGAAQDTLRQLDSSIPVSRTGTMDQIVAASLSTDRFSMLLAGAFGAMALLLASVGIYGVLSYTVQHRAKELGIRMALGADSRSVRGLVMRHGAVLTGISLGLVGALWLTRFMASQLYGVTANDPLTFVVVVLVLAAIAALACGVPVQRATRLDPVVALREE